MGLEGGVGIGRISRRPSQQCLDTTEKAAQRAEAEGTVEQDAKPWIARKKVTTLAICLVVLPVLMTTVSRRVDAPWTRASFWTLASTSTRQESNTDRLLGGLLVPEFDEWSCQSRYQSAVYRKNVSRSPSAHLIKRLREQEALQRRCGPGTEAYRAATARLRSRHRIGANDTMGGCKYLVLVPYRGLGNRILAVASAFLYAMLTDRVLLLDRATSLTDLVCEPFPGTSWLLPPHLPIKNLQNLTGDVRESYRHLVQNDGDGEALVSKLRYVFVDLDHSCTYHDKLFYCDDERRFLHRAPWLVMRTDGYFVPALFLNPAYQEELDRMFPRKDAVFYLMTHYLFHPTNKVWGLITRFYNSYLRNSDERLGIQVRVFDGDSPYRHVLDQILACTSQEHLLPEVVLQEPMLPPPSTAGARSKAGYVGHGLGGLTPWIMFKPENLSTPNPPCRRAKSMEPCMHGPPFYDCRAKHGADTGKLVPHVRHCEDMGWGLKLVHPE
ncbi:galactoside 2-alpha-L-fucosyltransferase-like [Phragmites australis]|uniref:galactoside 2-alpha-L-fucosyltransferase-like n=1 Tax=Phragmites australis TaxID=29695 RepID=UPI002D782D07|nr:galactoside 2-alpha-L-fucosyltransferase-like [Phragmites australis]